MACGHLKDEEIIERYARHQLSPEEERTFEEHFFSCDQCFEKLQATERFVAGIGDAARRRLLDSDADERRKIRGWLFPGFAVSCCAALVLAGLVTWVFLVRLPGVRRELDEATARLNQEQGLRAELEKEAGRERGTQANVPFVMLEATRGSRTGNEAALPAGAQHLMLWVEVGGESRFRSFRLEVYASDHHLVEAVSNLTRNSYGALVVNLATENLASGDYLLKLSGEAPRGPFPVAEYQLSVHKP